MIENKRFTHNGIVIVDHLKKDLIYIDGDVNLLDLAEYVDKLQSENEQLKEENQELIRKKNMVYVTIDDKINELEKKYEFGKTVQNCPMFNIRFGIHILEELKKEFSYD